MVFMSLNAVGQLKQLIFFFLLCFSTINIAAEKVLVLDKKGKPVANAVVALLGHENDFGQNSEHVLEQKKLEFRPHVLAVMAGDQVSFPNKDKVQHHVYSFSQAKVFEIKLYKDQAQSPIVFEQPGIVVLGCNIHDHMQGYIYVSDSPAYAVTNKRGIAVLPVTQELVDVEVAAWHPRIENNLAPEIHRTHLKKGLASVTIDLVRPKVKKKKSRKYRYKR